MFERPGIQKLFEFVSDYNKKNSSKIELFLADDVDRIARDYQVHLNLKAEMLKVGLSLETVKQKFEDTPVGKFVEGIMALNAELFR